MLDPPIHVHWPALYSHRSFTYPSVSAESYPCPPKSQKFPAASVQVLAPFSAPGTLLGADFPWVALFPFWLTTLDPPTLVHCPALYSHRSFTYPSVPAESYPCPPKSQKFPAA